MSEPVQSYTPTLTNVTLGNGTITGSYHRSDGYCDFAIQLGFGSTTSFTGAVGFSLPVAAGGVANGNAMPANCMFYDASVGLVPGYAQVNGTTTITPTYFATVTTFGYVNSTTPFTWAVNDGIWIKGRYRMTTRYS